MVDLSSSKCRKERCSRRRLRKFGLSLNRIAKHESRSMRSASNMNEMKDCLYVSSRCHVIIDSDVLIEGHSPRR